MLFRNRTEAGRALAERLVAYASRDDAIVLALPRGGVPVAFEIAGALGAPLDVFMVRKLGTPGHRELAMGAIATGGVRVMNDDVVQGLGITPAQVEAVAAAEQQELQRREEAFRGTRPAPDLAGRVVILVDDGFATGATMKVAVLAARRSHPSRVIAAAPVTSQSARDSLTAVADELVYLAAPSTFSAVGEFYEDFSETSDEEVRALIAQRQQ
jgi:predicted phosphoribosyltransferase